MFSDKEGDKDPKLSDDEIAKQAEELLEPFLAEFAQRREMWSSQDFYIDLATQLVTEVAAFSQANNGLVILSPIVLANTPIEEYGTEFRARSVDELATSSLAIKEIIHALIEETIGDLLRNNPKATLRPSGVLFSQLQAINVSTDHNRPIIIVIGNNPPDLATPGSDQNLVLTLEEMRVHTSLTLQKIQGLTDDFSEGLQRLTLLPREEKAETVKTVRSYVDSLIKIASEEAEHALVQMKLMMSEVDDASS